MLRFIISFILFLSMLRVTAQTDSIATPVTDSIIKKQPVKIRFGFDLGKYIWAQLQESKSYDFYIDANFYKDYYIIVSYGSEDHLTDNNLLNYHTKGQYYKLGISYNLYRNWLDMNNDITVSLNYAFANYDYKLHSFRVNQPGAAYSPQPIVVEQTFAGNSAHWIELASSIQVETFKHIFLGYAVQAKYLVSNSSIDNFTTTYIPGFFNKNTYSNFGFGMQYFISYQIKF